MASTPRSSIPSSLLGYLLEGGCLACAGYLAVSCGRFLSRRGEGGPWPFLAWGSAALLLVYGLRLAWSWWRRRPFTWGRFRWAFTTQVLAWGGALFFSAGYREVTVHGWISVGAGTFAALRLVQSLSGDRAPSRGARILDLLLFNLCLIGFGLEVGLRALAYVHPAPIFDRHDDTAAERLRRFAHPKGRVRHGFPHNAARHYDEEFGPKRPGQRRVLCIGDSFSVGVVPHYYHFTTVAERLLGGLEICNMGVPSIGPYEYLHLYRTQGRALDPDVVVVQVFVGNDVAEAAAHGGPRSFWKSFYDRSNVLLALIPRRVAILQSEAGKLAAGTYDDGEVEFVGRKHRRVEQVPEVLHREYPWLADPSREIPAITKEQFLVIERKRRDTALGRQGTVGYQRFFAGLQEIVDAVAPRPLAIVLIPDEFQVHDALWADLQAVDPVPEADRNLPQRRIAAWLKARGVPCLDLLPRLRAVPPMADGQRHLYHLRDTHFNARGNDVTAQALATFLKAHFATPLGLK